MPTRLNPEYVNAKLLALSIRYSKALGPMSVRVYTTERNWTLYAGTFSYSAPMGGVIFYKTQEIEDRFGQFVRHGLNQIIEGMIHEKD
jgi:hypothetical protein